MSEYTVEPVRGLPGHLPPGEYIVWQGSPQWRPLARRAFHTHLVAGYFAVLVGWAVLNLATGRLAPAAAWRGIAVTGAVGVGAVALLALLGWLAARATVYTVTSRRIVLRFGVALPKCVNLPFARIASAGLERHRDGSGDIVVAVGEGRLGFVHLWPNVRPWRVGRPEPMLRGLAEPERVARLLADALGAAVATGARSGAAAGAAAAADMPFVPAAVAA